MQVITLKLPDDTLQRYQHGARVAHKGLEEFLAERLADAAPPLAETLPSPFSEELKQLEEADDTTLWKVTQSQLSPSEQHAYNRLLRKNAEETITPAEQEKLNALGEQARLLTLKKAHAYMLLKWRGHDISLPEE